MTEEPDLQRRRFLFGTGPVSSRAAASPVACISPSCFARMGIACMSCRDACSTGAVRFELALGGARPRIDTDQCSGCGDCIQACPADAIRLAPAETIS